MSYDELTFMLCLYNPKKTQILNNKTINHFHHEIYLYFVFILLKKSDIGIDFLYIFLLLLCYSHFVLLIFYFKNYQNRQGTPTNSKHDTVTCIILRLDIQ